MKHKGIIFDMDGTLWDSAENVAKSWNKAIADYGYERAPITKEDMYSVMGKTMGESFILMLKRHLMSCQKAMTFI